MTDMIKIEAINLLTYQPAVWLDYVDVDHFFSLYINIGGVHLELFNHPL